MTKQTKIEKHPSLEAQGGVPVNSVQFKPGIGVGTLRIGKDCEYIHATTVGGIAGVMFKRKNTSLPERFVPAGNITTIEFAE